MGQEVGSRTASWPEHPNLNLFIHCKGCNSVLQAGQQQAPPSLDACRSTADADVMHRVQSSVLHSVMAAIMLTHMLTHTKCSTVWYGSRLK
jgi:hypothetical protein